MTENITEHTLSAEDIETAWDNIDTDAPSFVGLSSLVRADVITLAREMHDRGREAGGDPSQGYPEIKAADVRKGDVLRKVSRYPDGEVSTYPSGVAAKQDGDGDWLTEDSKLLTCESRDYITTYLISRKPAEHPDPEAHKLIHARRVRGEDLDEPSLLVAKGDIGYFSLTDWRWYGAADIEDFGVVEVKSVAE